MKEFNKILYDILLKIEQDIKDEKFKINKKLILKYFAEIKSEDSRKISLLESYFDNFFNFCFEINHDNVIEEIQNFKF